MSRARSFGVVCSLAVLSLSLPSGSARAADPLVPVPVPVRGTIVSRLLTGPACTSPISLCTAGTIDGHPSLKGSFIFTAKTLTPTADTPETGVMHYTGDITIRTAQGTVFIKDAGAINWTKGGTGDVAAVSTIIRGPGILPGLKGRLRISGTFTPEAGGKSEYVGYLIFP
jgi:hypothetical protein